MSRGLSAGNLTAIASTHVRPLVFVKLEFDSATQYLHNGVGTYTWGGFTWTGIGALGEVSQIEESIDLSPYGVTMSMCAFDPTLLAIAVGEPVFNRPVAMYIGLLDENGVLVADPQERWSGYMDSMTISLGGNDAIALQCESEDRYLDQANGSLFTDEDQQLRYSGDLFFQYLDQMMDAKVFGGAGAVVPGNLGGKHLPGGKPPPTPRDRTPKRGLQG